MATKCEMSLNSKKKKNHWHLQKTKMTANKEYLRVHRCEITNMAYKYKIFEAVN